MTVALLSRILTANCLLLSALPLVAQYTNQFVEPDAGNWKTWIISSGKDFRVAPPPDDTSTKAELQWVRGAVAETNPAILDSVNYWDAGAPGYRWIDVMTNRLMSGANVTAFPHRVYTYLALAIYDTTIAAWDSKYAYNRRRPNELDPTLPTRLPTPRSPSYPLEHAATAAAAAAVLSYFFPDEAASFQSRPNKPANRDCTRDWSSRPTTLLE